MKYYPLIVVVCLSAAFLSSILIYADAIAAALFVSSVLQFGLTLYAAYIFLFQKESIGYAVAIGFTFLFFFFQPLNPYNFQDYILTFERMDRTAVLLGFASANLAPFFLSTGIRLWGVVLRPLDVSLSIPLSSGARVTFQKWMFFGFCCVFAVTFVVYILIGDLVMLSIRQVFALRAGKAEFATIGAIGGLTGLVDLPFNCCLFAAALYKTRYRKYICICLPLILLWSLGAALGGTRTLLLMLLVMVVVVLIAFTRMNVRKMLLLGLIAVMVLAFAQLAVKARRGGWENFRIEDPINQIVDIEGLEGLIDQSRSYQYLIDSYYPLWITPNSILGLPIGIIHRGSELIYHWVPRMFFPQKPLDPTFVTYTEYSINWTFQTSKLAAVGASGRHTGFGYNMTAGLFGRDTVRYGYLGAFVTTFWLSLFLYLGDVCFRHRRSNPYGIYISAALIATTVTMFRGFEVLWTVHALPFVYIALPCLLLLTRPRMGRH